MYTLRQMRSNGSEDNSALGQHYTVYHVDKSPEQFKMAFKDVFGEDYSEEKKCFALVYAGKDKYPIYLGDVNYIVTESGKTFSNISY